MPSGIYKRTKKPIKDRFWKYVNKTKGCWLWTASRSGSINNQYGELHYQDKMEKAHRISWMIHYGDIPDGLFVLHKCDVPLCVRPDHLFLGTQKDNVHDMFIKHRENILKGEDSVLSKLTKKQVIKIRKMYATGEYYQYELGKLFGVGQAQICCIVNNKSWAHI